MTERIQGTVLDADGRPYVAASVWFPNQKLPLNVPFLLDTGSDRTILSREALIASGIGSFSGTRHRTEDLQVYGSAIRLQVQLATFGFRTETHRLFYDVEVCIPPDEFLEQGLPSLLGRDLLNRWRLLLDYRARVFRVDAHTWDARTALDR